MMDKKISIIVPIYKVEKYLNKCIESICDQTYKNIEIILVDDGSQDSCGIICDKWKEKDKRIKVLHKKNGGLVSARKAGLQLATGYFVTFVDGDDWISSTLYEELIKEIEKTNIIPDLVCFGFSRIFSNSSCLKFKNTISSGLYIGDSYKRLLKSVINGTPFYTMGIFPNVWSKLFLREKLIHIQQNVDNKISIGEDFVVTFPYIMISTSALIVENYGYMYRVNPTGMTGSRDIKYIEKIRYLCDWIYKNMYRKNGIIDRQLELYIAHILLNGIRITLNFKCKMPYKEKIRKIGDTIKSNSICEFLKNMDMTELDLLSKMTLITTINNYMLLSAFFVHWSLAKDKLSGK